MRLGQLNKTVVLFDADFLNEKLKENLEFYKDLYPDKKFRTIPIDKLLSEFVKATRIQDLGDTVDVIFAYTRSTSTILNCEPEDLFHFGMDNGVNIQTGRIQLKVRSFFAEEDETCRHHFISMLQRIYFNPDVARIILVADNADLHFELERMLDQNTKDLFLIKDRRGSHIGLPIKYVEILYPVAYTIGLEGGEI